MMTEVPFGKIAEGCSRIWNDLIGKQEELGLCLSRSRDGVSLLDCGIAVPGSREAGCLITELVQGSLSSAELLPGKAAECFLPSVSVESYSPSDGVYGMQVARNQDGIMLSGPMRMLLEKETDPAAGKCDRSGFALAVLQTDTFPADEWMRKLARDIACEPCRMKLLLVPMASEAGCTQIAGRMNENVIYTLVRCLRMDPSCVESIRGISPVCPVYGRSETGTLCPDDLLHYAAKVELTMKVPEGEGGRIAAQLCFSSSSSYGKMFADLLQEAGGDFYRIPDLMNMNKVAEIALKDSVTDRVFHAGKTEWERLEPYL